MAEKEKRGNSILIAGANSSTLEQSWAKKNKMQIKVTLDRALHCTVNIHVSLSETNLSGSGDSNLPAKKEKRGNSILIAGANSSTLEQSWAKKNKMQIKVTLDRALLKSFYLRSSDKFSLTLPTKIVYKLKSDAPFCDLTVPDNTVSKN